MTKLIQTGLTCKNGEAMELFADRVSEYNHSKGFVVLDLEAREQQDGTWGLTLNFKSRAYAKDFWTDPDYQMKVLT